MSQGSVDVEAHILRRYDIHVQLSQGARSFVYRAVDLKSKQLVVVKKIVGAFQNSTDAQRTFREIMFLQALKHGNIIRLLNVHRAENDKDIYLVLEFMETDLHVLIRAKLLEEIHKQYITYQLLKTLKYLHSTEILHCDIMPCNLLLNSDCLMKVGDFGLSRSVTCSNPDLPLRNGEEWYRAPEIIVGSSKYTKGVDMWSVGCIIGELVLDKPIFPGQSTLNQLERIVAVTGRPSKEDIDAMNSNYAEQMFGSLNKVPAKTLAEMCPKAPAEALDLMTKLLHPNPNKRLSAADAIEHPYVASFHQQNEKEESVAPGPITVSLPDHTRYSVSEYRDTIYQEIALKKRQTLQRSSQQEKEQQEKEQREKEQREKEQREKEQRLSTLKRVRESILVKGNKLGSGGTCKVIEVTFYGAIAAAKIYNDVVTDDKSVQRDLNAAAHLVHPNIVSTLAVIVDDTDSTKIVGLLMEKMGPNLLEAVTSSNPSPSLPQILQWCVEAACGMIVAHAMRIIHSDIKPENVMLSLSNPPVAKLSDFGSAHVLSTVVSKVTSIRGSGINISPEYGDGLTGPTPESDVFAFGMMLWQVLHPRANHGLGTTLTQIGRAIDKGRRPLISPQLLPELNALIEGCWHQDAAARPKMEKVVQELRDCIARLRSSNTIQYQPSNIWTSPNLLRNSYGNLVQHLSSLTWSVSANTAPLLLSSDVTDIDHPLFQFVLSKLRPTPFVQRTATFQTDYPFTRQISRIQFVHSEISSMMFAQIHDSDGKTRGASAVLKVANSADPDSIAAIAKLQSVFEDPPSDPINNSFNLSRILFAWHGTGADFVEEVCRDGPRALRTTDGGFFGAGSYFALEAEYAARYAMMYGGNSNNEYSMILYAVSVSQTYPITLEKDYRKIEDSKTPHLFGFSNFYSPDGNKAVALLPKYDSHFVPTKKYHYKHPLGNYLVEGQMKQTVAFDLDFQACSESDPDTVGHELVIGSHLRALPIAIVYFR